MNFAQRAREAWAEGRVDDTIRACVAALERAPRDVDTLVLLAVALIRRGDPAAALDVLARAPARHPVASLHRARAHLALGEAQAALEVVRRVVRSEPSLVEAQIVWIEAAIAAGHPGEVRGVAEQRAAGGLQADVARRARVRRALGHPDPAEGLDADGWRRFARALDPARPDDAPWLQRAAEGCPGDREVATRCGLARLAAGDPAGALRWLDPEDADPRVANAVGVALLGTGAPEAALPPLARAVEAGVAGAAPSFADAAFLAAELPGSARAALGRALASPDVDAVRLDGAVRRLLGASGVPSVASLIDEPLLVPWLSRSVVADPEWEDRLVEVRSAVLRGAGADALALAFALQADAVEYAWATPPEDRALAEHLVAKHVRSTPSEADVAAVLRAAMVLPPDALAALRSDAWRATPLGPWISAALDEPDAERAEPIEGFGAVRDATSALVQAQYEDNPYPRRVGLQRRSPVAIGAFLEERFPGGGPWPDGPIEVLVAGAGTGQHPLTTATTFRDATVTAVDLSRRSLARAARWAAREGLSGRVRFLHGDLLELDDLGRTFDVVESVGVLHHLEDPALGLAALVRRARPGGLLRLGLYHTGSRADVVAARALTSDLPRTRAGLLEMRERLRRLPADHPARAVVWSPDFPSPSGMRDLVAHACERTYTVDEAWDLWEEAGLAPIGLQHPMVSVTREAQRRAADLGLRAAWRSLEAERPRLFVGMIVCWCRALG